MLAASDGQVWLGYFDEGIYGNYGWGQASTDEPVGVAIHAGYIFCKDSNTHLTRRTPCCFSADTVDAFELGHSFGSDGLRPADGSGQIRRRQESRAAALAGTAAALAGAAAMAGGVAEAARWALIRVGAARGK